MPTQGDTPVQATVPVQTDVPTPAGMPAQAGMSAPADVPSQSVTHGRRDVLAWGDYKAIAKHTRSASSRNSTCLVKKPHHSLTTKLAKELSSSRRASEVAGAVVKVSMPVVAADEVASDITIPAMVTLETISKTVLTTSELDVIIVAGLGTVVIPSPSVMMPGMATPHSLTIVLVSSRKLNSPYSYFSIPIFLLFYLFLLFSLCNGLYFRRWFTATPFCLRSIALI